ncbi:MAG: hypothetical protein NTY12_04675 [Candidatus Falkowbacteria bacterium]|nr:hypothetical protein [Candidatus Falkowbacteria bacterium]
MAGIDEVDPRTINIKHNQDQRLDHFSTKQLEKRHGRYVRSITGKDLNPNKPAKTNSTLRDKRVDWSKYIDFDYCNDSGECYILDMFNLDDDEPVYEDMNYNKYLAYKKMAS